MSTRLATHLHAGELRDSELRRTPPGGTRAPVPSTGLPGQATAIIGLQRTVGNAAVARLLRGPVTPPVAQRELVDDPRTDGEGGVDATAPGGDESAAGETATASASVGAGEGGGAGTGGGADEGGGAGEGGSEAGAMASGSTEEPAPDGGPGSGGAEAGAAASGPTEASAPDGSVDAGDHTAEEVARKMAEGDRVTDSDPEVPMEGGAPPYAMAGGFHDGGRRATVPFGTVDARGAEAEEASHPHAYTGGGRTGTAAWSGGGPAGGPKGNQGSGSLQAEVAPTYDTRSNGPTSKADAWVRAGTGTVDVHRDYVSSTAGDQGNGWWISTAAASALEAHEQRHIAASQSVYGSTIGPMLARVAESETRGKGQAYWASDAIALLARYIGWKAALAAFKEQDAQWNANQGEVDQRDFGSPGYPRNMRGPRTIGGKEYQNYLILGSEPDPT